MARSKDRRSPRCSSGAQRCQNARQRKAIAVNNSERLDARWRLPNGVTADRPAIRPALCRIIEFADKPDIATAAIDPAV